MINPNKFIGLKQQQSMGQLTDPQSFQQQFNVNRFTQPLAVPGDQNQTMSPMMQTNYPHAPKQMPIDRVRDKIVPHIERVEQEPYRTGYKKIVRTGKVSEMKAVEEPARIQEQVQTISPFRQDDPGTKYKAVNVQDLEDMGRIKKDKISQYVVNSNEMKTGTSRDTLRLPKDAKHYSGKKYKTGQMIDESDFEDFTKQYNK